MLHSLGYLLHTSACVSCRAPYLSGRPAAMSFRLGGVLCPKCSLKHENPPVASRASLDVLDFLRQLEPACLDTFALPGAVARELGALSESYITHITGRALRTSRFLK